MRCTRPSRRPPRRRTLAILAAIGVLPFVACSDGGGGGCAAVTSPRDTVEVFSAINRRWRFGPPVPDRTFEAECESIGRWLYALTDDGFFRMDAGAEIWEALPAPPVARARDVDMASLGTDIYAAWSDGTIAIFDSLIGAWGSAPSPTGGWGTIQIAELGGRIYALGTSSTAVESFDPATVLWTPRADVPREVNLVIGDDILLFAFSPEIWMYDPTSDAWSAGPAVPAGLVFDTEAVLLPDGIHLPLAALNRSRTVARLDTTTHEWATLPGRRRSRSRSGVAAIGDVIYLVGGTASTPCAP